MEDLIKENFDLEREVENLTLRIKEIKGKIKVNDAELRKYLEENGLVEEEFNDYILRLNESKIPKVEILDEKKILPELLNYKETIQPNKTAIKEYLKNNPDCEFATLTYSEPKLEYKRI